jgi:hypothetical protein
MQGATVHTQQVIAAVHARQGERPLCRGRRIVLYQVDDRPPPGAS